jgi:hypothetical protein
LLELEKEILKVVGKEMYLAGEMDEQEAAL